MEKYFMNTRLFSSFLTLSLTFGTYLMAEAEETIPPPDQSFWQTLVMLGIAFIFFYLILWRPEQKRKKALENQRNTLKKGDKVVAMGIIGTVDKLEDQTVIVKMIDGAKIQFYKAAITDILAEEPAEEKK